MNTLQVTPKPPSPAELIRLTVGFRRSQVASAVGISLRTLDRIERGLAWGKPETLHRIAQVLGVEPEAYVVAVLQSWRQTKARKRGVLTP